MIIDCVSDLHGFYPELQGGDLLIVSGDLTARDEAEQHIEFSEWLDAQSYIKKIVIAGNHDNNIDADSIECLTKCYYLEDSRTEFESLKIWGSPWSLWFKGINPHCKAFTGSELDLQKHYDKIPLDTDILITHGPAYRMLDSFPIPSSKLDLFGSTSLRIAVEKIKPKLHVFGHIHEGYGLKVLKREDKDTICVNASHVDIDYRPVNKPIRVIL